MCVTGNGTAITLTHATGTWLTDHPSADLISVSDIVESLAVVDDNDLTSTFDKKCKGDIATYEPIELTYRYQDGKTSMNDVTSGIATIGTEFTGFSVVLPDSDTYTFTGAFISGRTITNISNNERILVTFTIQPTTAGAYLVAGGGA